MESKKLKEILELLQENEKDETKEDIKTILRSLIGDNAKNTKDLWFEKVFIKKDKEFYGMVFSMIDILFTNLKENKTLDLETISENMVKIVKASEYFWIFQQIRLLFIKLDSFEKPFDNIYWAVNFLGFKRETPFNKKLIENLKDISLFDKIIESNYSRSILEFNYDNINEKFLSNFNEFICYILTNPKDENKISELIQILSYNADEKEENAIKNNLIYPEIPKEEKEEELLPNNDETDITTNSNKDSEKEEEVMDDYEDFIKDFKPQENKKDDLEQTILLYVQRQNRINGIIGIREKIKNQIKELKFNLKSQKDLLSYFCYIQDNLISINNLKSIINQMKPPVLSNTRRKFIDMFIYWIIKNNKKYILIDRDYSPNDSYLDKILNELKKKPKNTKIEDKIKFINGLKKQGKSVTKYPLEFKQRNISDLISYFSFFKKKCSQIIHIGKDSLKNYILPDQINSISPNIFNEEEEGLKDFKYISKNKNKSSDEIVKKADIDIKYAYDLLFKPNFNYINEDQKVTSELKSIKNKKNERVDETSEKIVFFCDNLLKKIEKNNDQIDCTLSKDKFDDYEINYIIKALVEHENKIKTAKNKLSGLTKDDMDYFHKYSKIINEISEEVDNIAEKEFYTPDKYFIDLGETLKGKPLLIYLQYKYMKVEELYDLILYLCDLFSKFIMEEENDIKKSLLNFRIECENLNKKMKDKMKMKSGKEIFIEWKKKKGKEYNFNSFDIILKKEMKGITKLKIDNDIITDEVTSCWLIENGLDELVF